jgi:crotonobetainyl-CoA:carnitine CoA-transferase CaiB-like acyl-CoA transferase
LTALLEVEFASNTVDHWVTALNNAGVPAGPVYDVPQIFEDKQVQHLNVVATLPNVYDKDMHYITQPMTLSRTPAAVKTPAPKWGEHTEEVLKEIGFNAEQIKVFFNQGVV